MFRKPPAYDREEAGGIAVLPRERFGYSALPVAVRYLTASGRVLTAGSRRSGVRVDTD
jgi:hypothetical protein